MPFTWHPNGPLPRIEEHSKAKLAVLRRYVRAYFDRLNINPSRDQFKLDLVDGFAGGGTFRDGDEVLAGTPLIFLEESEAAQERLNQGRTKPLHFDCRHYFVDVERDHTDHLRKVLVDRGYQIDGEKIVVHDKRFQDVANEIIKGIRRRQPRAGRAIFLLDQTGFSQVELDLIARIFRELPKAEVILTFAADALVNYLSENRDFAWAGAPLGVTRRQMHDLIQLRNGDGGRALVQRVLRKQIRSVTGATFDTPFYIRPRQSRRALWFLHLSRHPTARDVMIQCHWDSSNVFEHYGSGDFDMLGWDALNAGTLPLFHFENLEVEQMRESLLNSMPAKLHALAADTPITIDRMRHVLANKTAARFSDLDRTVIRLAQEREFDILNADGKIRSRDMRRLRPTDLIAIPTMKLFPVLSRLPDL